MHGYSHRTCNRNENSINFFFELLRWLCVIGSNKLLLTTFYFCNGIFFVEKRINCIHRWCIYLVHIFCKNSTYFQYGLGTVETQKTLKLLFRVIMFPHQQTFQLFFFNCHLSSKQIHFQTRQFHIFGLVDASTKYPDLAV